MDVIGTKGIIYVMPVCLSNDIYDFKFVRSCCCNSLLTSVVVLVFVAILCRGHMKFILEIFIEIF